MSDSVRQFLEADQDALASQHKDLTKYVLKSLQVTMDKCANDNELSLAEMDYDSPSYPYFLVCVKNNVHFNPKLN